MGYFFIFPLGLAALILCVAGMWKTFEKAGAAGYLIFIPIYNLVIICRIAGKHPLWIFLLCIPLVNIVANFILMAAIAKKFGKGLGFGVGLMALPVIFYPILGFGEAKYFGARVLSISPV